MSTLPGRASMRDPASSLQAQCGEVTDSRCVFSPHSLVIESHTNRVTVRWRRVAPIAPNRRPCVAQPFFIGIAVLRHDPGHALGACQCNTEAGGSTVIEDIQRVARQA